MPRRVSLLLSACAFLCLAAPAQAASSRAWVSGRGTDTAGCGAVASPCRTLQYVLNNIIAPKGEIDILDPAGYGSMTINFAVNVINTGVGTAGVLASPGQNAVTINAAAGDGVNLQGLTIEGQGSGLNGVQFNSGGSLGLAGSQVYGFTGVGVNFKPGNGAGVVADLTVSATSIYGNGADDVVVQPQGGTLARATFKDNCTVSFSPIGILSDGSASASGSVHTSVSNCAFGNISGQAVQANGTAGKVHVMVERSGFAHVETALRADGSNASISLDSSIIAHTGSPTVSTGGGGLTTFGNNAINYTTNAASFTSSIGLQ